MQPRPLILVIEDDPDSRENLCLLLEMEGYSVRGAEDGEKGLERLYEMPIPNLVLCDLMLPGLDGFAILETVRRQPQFADLPFLILTARTDRASQRMGMNLCADDFITKPFSAEEILSAVASQLRRQHNPAVATGLDSEEGRRLTLLTERERQILIRIGQGQTSREIAEGLGISPKTEQGHRSHILLKLALPNSQAIASFAARAGLLQRSESHLKSSNPSMPRITTRDIP